MIDDDAPATSLISPERNHDPASTYYSFIGMAPADIEQGGNIVLPRLRACVVGCLVTSFRRRCTLEPPAHQSQRLRPPHHKSTRGNGGSRSVEPARPQTSSHDAQPGNPDTANATTPESYRLCRPALHNRPSAYIPRRSLDR